MNKFFGEKIKKIFTEKKVIIDIGGGLRVDPRRNNRGKENAWLDAYMQKTEYKVLDKIQDFHPDIIGDIHNLPFADNSIDAFICISVLEHVEEPQRAVREMYRALKPGGFCYIYVPFLFYYHPMEGYYSDFYRFTHDGCRYLTRDFRVVETHTVRGAIATVFNLFPLFSKRTEILNIFDRLFKKTTSNQTSGYDLFCVK